MPEIGIADKATLDLIKVDTTELLARMESIVLEKDPYGAPGPNELLAGTLDYGYFGTVEADELITGSALASSIGLSQGTAQFDDVGWLKFALDQKILFIACKTFRHTISWDAINAVGAVFGTKTVSIGGKTYKVRLLTGGNSNPASVAGGEWNMLMYAVHQDEWPRWEHFTDRFLHTHNTYGNGSYSWCQETSAFDSTNRVLRGGTGVGSFSTITSSSTLARIGWRPVLEIF